MVLDANGSYLRSNIIDWDRYKLFIRLPEGTK